MARVRGMHQTTIRFGHELWDTLELAAGHAGVSVAQYVREAAIERLVRSGAFGDVDEISKRRFTDAARELEGSREAMRALEAQSQLARSRARTLRAGAEAARER